MLKMPLTAIERRLAGPGRRSAPRSVLPAVFPVALAVGPNPVLK